MAVGLPLKTTYANGDVFSASDINDTNGTINITAAPFAAGKNKIINGDFGIWQRGTSFTSTAGVGVYTADRFRLEFAGTGASATVTQQTFTPGSAPVAGYEGRFFSQVATTSGSDTGSYITYEQRIEDVRTFAGQTATISLWARATSGTPKLGLELIQAFDGSAGVFGIGSTTVTLSTTWTRYSFTYTVPSVSGKTIGSTSNLVINFWLSNGSSLSSRSGNPGLQSNTFQFWGIQAESGSTATAFQTASGSLGGELALCQRYYWRTNAVNTYSIFGTALGGSTTAAYGYLMPNVKMRAMNSMTSSNIALLDGTGAVTSVTLALQGNYLSDTLWGIIATAASGLTANRPYHIQANNNSAAFVAVDGEL
jgi:hypothetical protein